MDTTRFEIGQDGVARLQTSKGVLMMDAEDLHLLEGGYMEIRRGYARMRTYGKPRKNIGTVSRLVMDAQSDMVVDHINHNTLDNRRCNLRVCTRSENRRNGRKHRQSKARFKGVFYHAHGTYSGKRGGKGRWRSYTRVKGKRIWLGYYATDIEAAMAYNRFAANEFGEFACFNRFDRCPVLRTESDLFRGLRVLPASFLGNTYLDDIPQK